ETETEIAAVGGERRGRAAAALAEVEVAANDDTFDLQPPDQDLLHEGIGGHRRERPVERDDDQAVETDRGQNPRLCRQRRQAKDRYLRLEDGARMRLEGEHHGGNAT